MIKNKFFFTPIILILFIQLFSTSCQQGQKPLQDDPLKKVDFYKVEDLDFTVFDNPKYQKYYNKTYDDAYFKKQFFSSWESTSEKITDEEWAEYFTYADMVTNSPCYGGNYREHPDDWIKQLSNNLPTDQNNFPHLQREAITITTADIRTLPTLEFCFKSMRDAGEGYPFDYLQHSTIWRSTPVKVLSQTKDELWYFVQTPNGKGWVQSHKIAFVSPQQIQELKESEYMAVLKENWTLKGGRQPVQLNVGVLLPLLPSKAGQAGSRNKKSVHIPYANLEDQSLVFDEVTFDEPARSRPHDAVGLAGDQAGGSIIKKFPIQFDAANVKQLLNEIYGGKYSWGGLDGGRDCSSTLKDFLTPFGIWLPRDSKDQFKSGEQIALEGTTEQKFEVINQQAVPFLSSVYKRGHIMLYVGTNNVGEHLIYHTVWGLKAFLEDAALKQVSDSRDHYGLFGMNQPNETKDEIETRFIIAKTVITTLIPEKQLMEKNHMRMDSFMDKIQTLTILPDKSNN